LLRFKKVEFFEGVKKTIFLHEKRGVFLLSLVLGIWSFFSEICGRPRIGGGRLKHLKRLAGFSVLAALSWQP